MPKSRNLPVTSAVKLNRSLPTRGQDPWADASCGPTGKPLGKNHTRNRKRVERKRQEKYGGITTTSNDPIPVLGGFASLPERKVGCIYQNGPGPSTGTVTNKTEIGIMVTDFFEYGVGDPSGVPQFVSNYFWEINQNLFDNATTFPSDLGQETWCRVRSVKVWVLPVLGFQSVGSDPGAPTSNSGGVFTVNVQTPGCVIEPAPGTTPAPTQRAFAMDTQVTNVTPQIDTFWKPVFSCDLQKTFQSGVARPFIQPFGAQARSQAQCIFQMSIVDPDSGKPFIITDNYTIKVKVQLMIDQPVSTLQSAGLVVFRNEEFTSPALEQNGAPYSPPIPNYVQMRIKSVMDNMR